MMGGEDAGLKSAELGFLCFFEDNALVVPIQDAIVLLLPIIVLKDINKDG